MGTGGRKFRKILGRILLGASVLVGGLVVLALGLVTYLFLKPHWELTTAALNPLKNLLAKVDVGLAWDDVVVTGDKPNQWTHHLSLSIKNFTLDLPLVPLRSKGRSLQGGLTLSWHFENWRSPIDIVKISTIDAWQLDGGDLWVGVVEKIDQTPSTFDINAVAVPRLLDGAVWQSSRFAFDRIAMATAYGELVSGATLTVEPGQTEFRTMHLKLSQNPGGPGTCWVPAATQAPYAPELLLPSTLQPKRETCLKELSFAAQLAVPEGWLRVTEIGPLRAQAEKLVWDLTRSKAGVGSSDAPSTAVPMRPGFTNPESLFPPIMADAKLASVDLAVRQSSLFFADGRDKGKLSINVAAKVTPTERAGRTWLDASVSGQNICLDTKVAKGCIEHLVIAGEAPLREERMTHVPVTLTQFQVRTSPLEVMLLDDAAPSPKKKTELSADLEKTIGELQWLKRFRVRPGKPNDYLIAAPRIVLQQETGATLANASAQIKILEASHMHQDWVGAFALIPVSEKRASPKGKKSPFSGLRSVKVNVQAKTDLESLRWEADLTGQVGMTNGIGVDLKANANSQTKVDDVQLRVEANVSGVKPLQRARTVVSGTIDPAQLNLRIQGDVTLRPDALGYAMTLPGTAQPGQCPEPVPGPAIHVSTVTWDQCTVRGAYASGIPNGRYNFDCPLNIGIQWQPGDLKASKAQNLGVGLTVTAQAAGAAKIWNGQAKLLVEKVQLGQLTDLIQLDSTAAVSFSMAQDDPKAELSWKTDGTLSLIVASFKQLVGFMQPTAFAIPAPLNVLDGTVQVSARMQGTSLEQQISVPLVVSTNLTSKEQSLIVGGHGEYRLERIDDKPSVSHFVFNVDPKAVKIVFPRIALRSKLPLFFPDERIELGFCPKPEEKPSTFDYTIAIVPDAQPLRFSTNLALDDIPVQLAGLTIDPSGLKGDIQVDGFNFELFRRRAKVNHFDVAFNPVDQTKVIDGDIQFDYPDYIINVLFTGTTEEPVVSFESIPVRTEREIISILLYGQDVEAIDEDQLQSADDMKAAMADRMIGLASLYLLASSPIESVRYNPASRVFQARVRIDKKTSLNLGATANAERSVGVRRRLTQSWSVQTNVEKDSETGVASGTALLEWSKRF